MRVVVVVAALVTVLSGCAPRDPVTYAQMACANRDGLLPGTDEYAACVQFVAENPPTVLLAVGGAMLGPFQSSAGSRRELTERLRRKEGSISAAARGRLTPAPSANCHGYGQRSCRTKCRRRTSL